MFSRTLSIVALSALFLAMACSGGGTRHPSGRDGGTGTDGSTTSMCSPGSTTPICRGTTQISCNADGTEAGTQDCSASGRVCAPGLGCATCIPNRGTCDGQTPGVCRADGSGYDMGPTCDPASGQSCNPTIGQCTSPCDDAVAQNSYIGCDYWAATTSNSQVAEEFTPALVVANPGTAAAQVTVTRGGTNIASVSVAPGALETINLPWVAALKGTLGEEASGIARASGYHLTSSLPVTVYQFNPLEFRIPRDCAAETAAGDTPDGQCFSYTNDASLLLPTHVLTGNYTILSRMSLVIHQVQPDVFGGPPQEAWLASPGYFTVVGVNATSDVAITFSANVIASSDGTVRAFGPGETGNFTLAQGDVLQILAQAPETCPSGSPSDSIPDPLGFGDPTTLTYCNIGPTYDLTGTQIRSAGKVEVFAGHNCDFVPNNRWACDHLEEQLFPYETWGKTFVASQTYRENGEPDLWRILSGADDNRITFQPATVHEEVILARGEHLEFEARDPFEIRSDHPILVGQFLVGQNYNFVPSDQELPPGDPAFALAVPTEQWRHAYNFLAPSTYDRSFINLIVAKESFNTILLDGRSLAEEDWQIVGRSDFRTLRLGIPPGSHTIYSDDDSPFGILVYGFGQYTSYMYPGGLNLDPIAVW